MKLITYRLLRLKYSSTRLGVGNARLIHSFLSVTRVRLTHLRITNVTSLIFRQRRGGEVTCVVDLEMWEKTTRKTQQLHPTKETVVKVEVKI